MTQVKIEQELPVSLSELHFINQKPCQTVYSITKALLLPEAVKDGYSDQSTVERILRLAWKAIAKQENVPETIDVAKNSERLDIITILNLSDENRLNELQSTLQNFFARLRFFMESGNYEQISTQLIDNFIENLFFHARVQKDAGRDISVDSIFDHMRQASIEDFSLLIATHADFETQPDTMAFGKLIANERAVFYDFQPFVAKLKELSDPDDVMLLFEANRGELNSLSEDQQNLLISHLLGTYRSNSYMLILVMHSVLTNITPLHWKAQTELNQNLEAIIDALTFRYFKDSLPISESTLLLFKEKNALVSSMLQQAFEGFARKHAGSFDRFSEIATYLISHDFLTKEWWDKFASEIKTQK